MHLVYRNTPVNDDVLQCVIDVENERTGRTYRLEATRLSPQDEFSVQPDAALQEDLYRQAAKIAPHSQREGDVFVRHEAQADYQAFFLVPAGPHPYSLTAVWVFLGQIAHR